MIEDIELLSIDPADNWPVAKKQNFEQLKVITARIIEKAIDITNGFGSDIKSIVAVYAQYATDEALNMLWRVCKLSPAFSQSFLEESWNYFSENNKLNGNRKIIPICKNYGIDHTMPNTDGPITDADELSAYIPDGVDPRFVLENGFYPYVNAGRTGYYFRTGDKSFVCQSNFTLEPLMHVYSKQDNKRIISIHNGFKQSILDMPSRAMISLDQFTATCYEEGNYMFWGSKVHLMKILNTINDKFPVCYELKTLGWQPEGFFAWSNAVFVPSATADGGQPVLPFNTLGIATVHDTHFFSPSASDIYKNQRQEDDEYENDRYLRHKALPALPNNDELNFSKWAHLFHAVYPEHSIYGIGYVFIGLFKDVIYRIDNNCPHLSAYGEKGTGKSKFAESVSAVFLTDLQPFNLNHGTDFAFFNRLSRFRNCVTWFDEFDDQAIKEDRFQSIKGAYDGAGRERGKGTNKNKTEIARINSALLLTGQYLSTRDDNAALSRCLVLAFTPNNDRSSSAINAYDTLKTIEKTGISGILTELLQHRHLFEKEYLKTFADTFATLRQMVTDAGGQYKERVLRNYTAIANCYRFFMCHPALVEGQRNLQLPFSYNQVLQGCTKDVIRLSTLISESDSLADFWNTVLYLLETGEIYEGFHFRVEERAALHVKKDGHDKELKFTTPTKLLFIRLTTIHALYMEAHKRQTGKTGINKSSLELYISSSKGYFGQHSSTRFHDKDGSGKVTSCYVFDYQQLNIPLETDKGEAETTKNVIEGYVDGPVAAYEMAGKPVLKYTIRKRSTYKLDGMDVHKDEKTTIFDRNLQNKGLVETNNILIITGILKESKWTSPQGEELTKRSMDAASVELKSAQIEGFKVSDDMPSF